MTEWQVDVTGLELVGLTLQLLGTILAGQAAVKDWREHGRGAAARPLPRVLARALSWIRTLGRPPRTVTMSGTASGSLTAEGSVVTGEAPLADDAPVEEQVAFLRRRVSYLVDDVEDVRREAARAEKELAAQLADLAAEAARRDAELDRQLASVATGSVRRELLGLVLVGVGSIIATLG